MFIKRKIEKVISKTFGKKWKYGSETLFILDLMLICPNCKKENIHFFNGKGLIDTFNPNVEVKYVTSCSCGHLHTEKEILKSIEKSFPKDERTIREKMFEYLISIFIGEEFGNVERIFNLIFVLKIIFYIAIAFIGIHFLIKWW